jgi:hypothetical protein
MKWFLAGVLATLVIGGAVASSAFGWVPHYADRVLLGLAGTSLLLWLAHQRIVYFWDTTNGNDLGLIVFFIGLIVFGLNLLAWPVIALLFGKPWLCYGLGAGIMALYTLWATREMTRH